MLQGVWQNRMIDYVKTGIVPYCRRQSDEMLRSNTLGMRQPENTSHIFDPLTLEIHVTVAPPPHELKIALK